jgi:hypothetical protein
VICIRHPYLCQQCQLNTAVVKTRSNRGRLTIKTEIAAFGFHMETYVTFQFLTAANINLTASWAVGPCNIFEVERRFSGAYCLHHQGNDGGSTHL